MIKFRKIVETGVALSTMLRICRLHVRTRLHLVPNIPIGLTCHHIPDEIQPRPNVGLPFPPFGGIKGGLFLILLCISACMEETRFKTEFRSKTPPGEPTNITWKPLYGGARFFYTLPEDEDLLTVNAEYTNERGDTYYFSSSFFKDSVDIYGLGNIKEYTVYLYGVNRAGLQSKKVPVSIVPLEPALTRVAKTVKVKAGFGSFLLNWENELEQAINVYVYFKFREQPTGAVRDIMSVFSSTRKTNRQFIKDILSAPADPVNINIRVEDRYGNITPLQSLGDIFLLPDFALDKSMMKIPEANDSTIILRNGARFNTGVPAMYGEYYEGRMNKLIDGIIDGGNNLNFFHTGGRGRTGFIKDGNVPWNIIIDMGDYYRLSRVNTVQRHENFSSGIDRGQYYRAENCGEFNLYVFDEETLEWELASKQRTPVPVGMSELQIVALGKAGDEAYFYPDDPQYTKPARWFRYECLKCFDNNYSSTNANCMSELTLYGIKAN